MDYGRYVYEQEQRRRQSKRKATNVVIKEMKFRPKIDEHDYTTKMKHVVRFLGEGNKVKLTIMFRGREMAHPELGMKILNRVADDVGEIAMVESRAPPGRSQHDHGAAPHPQGRPQGQAVEQAATHAAQPARSERTRERSSVMPKMKTHRGAAKRFKVTGHGQDPAPQGEPLAPAREEVEPAHPPLGRAAEVVGGDKKQGRAPARPR